MINIDELITKSMKSGDKVSLNAYKNLKAEIQKVKTAKNAKPYKESTEIQIIAKMVKNLEDAISDFSKAHREDLVVDYKNELSVLKKLLPEPVDNVKLESTLFTWCVSMNFTKSTEKENLTEYELQIPKKEMGTAIKFLKDKYPQADGKLISSIVKEYVI